jgi:hypothetical protein
MVRSGDHFHAGLHGELWWGWAAVEQREGGWVAPAASPVDVYVSVGFEVTQGGGYALPVDAGESGELGEAELVAWLVPACGLADDGGEDSEDAGWSFGFEGGEVAGVDK